MEFIAIMNLLKGLKSMSTVMGRQQLVDIIIMQAELEHKFKVWLFLFFAIEFYFNWLTNIILYLNILKIIFEILNHFYPI